MRGCWMVVAWAAMAVGLVATVGCVSRAHATEAVDERRLLSFVENGEWIGSNVCYGPHRDGQVPDKGPQPTREQVAEDARIMARHWRMVRMYGAGEATEHLLRTIREERLPLRVMLGIWIAPETQLDQAGNVIARSEENAAKNREQVAEGIRLANEYRDEVAAIGVGNETQVFWSAYRCAPDALIGHIRTVRRAVTQPVTTCDGYEFWLTDESAAVAKEVDFIAVHIYAMWNKQRLEDALAWSRETWKKVRAKHEGMPLVVTEIGWATNRGNNGYQAEGVVGPWGEAPQEVFYRAVRDWAGSERIPYFWFQAFDEKWKGGDEPNEVEKHWGVYFSNRQPKMVMKAEEASKQQR